MNEAELGRAILGKGRAGDEPGRTTTYYGVALEGSSNGSVRLSGPWLAVTQDGEEGVTIPCTAAVSEGELVPVTVVNGAPMAGAPIGWGDRVAAVLAAQQAALDGAVEDAGEAAKVATNFIDLQEIGLVIGNMLADALGINTLMAADGFYVRNGSDYLAAYKDSIIDLGMKALTSIIRMCKGALEVTAQRQAYGTAEGNRGTMTAKGGTSTASVDLTSIDGYSKGSVTAKDSTGERYAFAEAEAAGATMTFEGEAAYETSPNNNRGTVSSVATETNGTAGMNAQYMSGSTLKYAQVQALANSSGGSVAITADDVTVNLGGVQMTLKPVYRVRNPNDGGDHLVTSSKTERDDLINNHGWLDDGVDHYAFAK